MQNLGPIKWLYIQRPFHQNKAFDSRPIRQMAIGLIDERLVETQHTGMMDQRRGWDFQPQPLHMVS